MIMILYSIDCPKCKVLEAKLKSKNIDYDLVTDREIIAKHNIDLLPVLEISGVLYNFSQAVKYINDQE